MCRWGIDIRLHYVCISSFSQEQSICLHYVCMLVQRFGPQGWRFTNFHYYYLKLPGLGSLCRYASLFPLLHMGL